MEKKTNVYKPVAVWNTDDVVAWISGLGECLFPHISQFQAHCICGSDLLKLNKQQLEYLKVTQMGHQELLLESVERLLAVDLSCNSANPTMTLVSTLSKKTSQLVTTLDTRPHPQPHPLRKDSVILSQVDVAADVMVAARSLINWLDRNPSNLVLDYNQFRQQIRKDALELSSISQQSDFDVQQMLEACRRILKLTQVLMIPQNFTSVEPIKLHIIPLIPSPETGLGVTLQRTKQGNIVVNGIRTESPAAVCGKIKVGDELIQINHQNVVGWEVTSVVQLLKECGHDVVMVMKAGLLHSQGEGERETALPQSVSDIQSPGLPVTTNGVVMAGGEESSDSLEGLVAEDNDTVFSNYHHHQQRHARSLSPGSDSDVSSPDAVPESTPLSSHHLKVQRTASNPILDGERSKVAGAGGLGGRARIFLNSCEFEEIEETDGREKLPQKRTPSYEALLNRRPDDSSQSNTAKDSEQNKLPPVAYRTQIVGGVVVRIPIKEDQASPRITKRGSGGKKPVRFHFWNKQ